MPDSDRLTNTTYYQFPVITITVSILKRHSLLEAAFIPVSGIHSRPATAFRHLPPWRKNAIHQCLEFVSGLQKLPLWSLPWFHTNCHKRLKTKTNKTLNIFWFWHVLNHTPMTYPWDVAITINGNWNSSDWVIHTDHWAEHVLSVFLGAFLKQKWLLSKTLLLPAPAHPLALCILVLTCMNLWNSEMFKTILSG